MKYLLLILTLMSFLIFSVGCEGTVGPEGPQGEQGLDGSNGKDGTDGKNAEYHYFEGELLASQLDSSGRWYDISTSGADLNKSIIQVWIRETSDQMWQEPLWFWWDTSWSQYIRIIDGEMGNGDSVADFIGWDYRFVIAVEQ